MFSSSHSLPRSPLGSFLPSISEVRQLSSQAGGHVGAIDATLDGEWILKATGQEEINFYEHLNDPALEHDLTSGLGAIKPWIPAYGGHQARSGYTRSTVDADGREVGAPTALATEDMWQPGKPNGADKHTESIALSNLTQGLRNGTVGDFKISKRTWGLEADSKKRARQDASAAGSTSGSCGVMFAGGVTYLPTRGAYVRSTNRYGHDLTEETLSDSIACIFPSVLDPLLPSERARTSDSSAPLTLPLDELPPNALALEKNMLSTLRASRSQLSQLADAIARTGWDFPGSSALVAYGEEEATGKWVVRTGWIDFTHAHKTGLEDGVPGDGVPEGFKKMQRMMEGWEEVLEGNVGMLRDREVGLAAAAA
ncbi:hypothetical protein IAT38_007484 [Cryptococcus sp. DSM 104549]